MPLDDQLLDDIPGGEISSAYNQLHDPSAEINDSDILAWHDGDLEANSWTAGWSNSTLGPRTGLRRLNAAPASAGLKLYNRKVFNVSVGMQLPYLVWAASTSTAGTLGTLRVGIEWQDAGQVSLGADSYTEADRTTNYSRTAGVGTAPSGAVYARYFLQVNSITTGSWFADDMMCGEGIPGELIRSDSTVTIANLIVAGLISFNDLEGGTISDVIIENGYLTNCDINADNNIIANIGAAEVKADLITGQTASGTADDADSILIYDNSAGAIRKQTRAILHSGLASTAYVDALLAANDALTFEGVIDCSANPNYPAADAGHVYKVSVAGKIGGASGPNVEAGDVLTCIVDGSASGNHATVGANWIIQQANIDGAVTGQSSSVDSEIALFSGTSGKIIKRATQTGILKATSGVISAATAGTDYQAPLPVVDTTILVKGSADATKQVRLEVDGLTTGATRVVTVPDADTIVPVATQQLTFAGPTAARTVTLPDANITVARTDAAQTFTGDQTVIGAVKLDASSGSGAVATLTNPKSTAGFSIITCYPGSGTDVVQTFSVYPKGSPAGTVKSQFSIFGTDPIADASNYEGMAVRATGSGYDFFSFKAGTGTVRGLRFSGTGAGSDQLCLSTGGDVGIGTASPASKLDVSETTGGVLTLRRVDTTVTANDMIGKLQFYAADASTTTNFIVADIEVQATNTVGTDINPGRLIFRTTGTGVAATPTERFRLDETGLATFAGNVTTSGVYQVSGTQVLGTRKTGYTSDPTCTLTRTTFDSTTVTLANLAARVAALIVDLRAHGLIGA